MALLSNVRLLLSILLLVGAGIVISGVVVTYKTKMAVQTSVFWTHRAESIISETHRLLALTKDIQVGTRGYVITGDSSFLGPVFRSKVQIPRVIGNMKALTLDNPIQGKRIDSVAATAQSFIGSIDECVKARKNFSASSDIISDGKSNNYVNTIKRLLERIQRVEFRLLKLRKEVTQKEVIFLDRFIIGIFVSLVIFIFLLFFAIRFNFLTWNRIEKQKNLYESIITSFDDVIFSENLQGTIISWSRRAEEVFNYSNDEIVGKPGATLLPPEILQCEIERLENIKRNKNITHVDVKRMKKNGERVDVSLTSSPLLSSTGATTGILHIARDITKRKGVEEIIRKGEQRFRSLIENSFDVVSIIDRNLKIVYRSPAATRVTGWENHELEDGTRGEITHPDDVEKINEAIKSVMKNPALPASVNIRIKHKEGHYVFLEGVITNRFDDASINGIVMNFRDVTATRKAEEKTKQSEKIYQTIASSIPGSVICLLDRDLRYMLIEGEMLERMGYSKSALLGNVLKNVISAERFSEIHPHFERVFSGESFTIENSTAGFDILSKYVPLRDEYNSVFAAMVVIFDISELKNAQRALAALNLQLEDKIRERTTELEIVNKELEAFSYSVAHDLRTPLRAIYGYSVILDEDYSASLDDEGRRLITRVTHNAKRMGTLIDDLLTFSRLGRKDIQRSEINMNRVIESCINDLNLKEGFHGTIDVKELDPIRGDFSLIKYAMINLLSNAVKYSSKKENPEIEISSERKGQNVIYSIKDNGVGFDMTYANKLFGVFQRLHSQDEFDGTGVGLAIVQRIIYRHHGNVWAEGEVNKGATFYISLPGN